VYNQALKTDAVLAGVLADKEKSGKSIGDCWVHPQNSTHPDACPFLKVRVRKDDGWIFAAQFQTNRGKMFCCSDSHLYSMSDYRSRPLSLHTLRPTSSEPMNVMCLIKFDFISASA
jgi:hypothetical protein